MKIFSPAFQEMMPIPTKYTYDGANVSVPLTWEEVPQGSKSLALVMDDPDAPAGIWVHWVIYNMPASLTGLTENQPKIKRPEDGSLQGSNSSNHTGYEGPRPPSGTHRYFFKLFALDNLPSTKPGLTKAELLEAMRGHILEQAEFYGTYTRK